MFFLNPKIGLRQMQWPTNAVWYSIQQARCDSTKKVTNAMATYRDNIQPSNSRRHTILLLFIERMAISGGGGGGEEEVKVLGGILSPFVLRTRFALNLKKVRYEFLEESFGIKSELLLKSNPVYKKMPVLIHGGKPICESLIIVQYIDDVWNKTGPSILPSDPYERAVALFWAVYIDDKLFSALLGFLKAKTEEAKAELAEKIDAGLQLLEEVFVKCSKGKSFFGGDTIGCLDIVLGCFLRWFATVEELGGRMFLLKEKVPSLVDWADRFNSDDAVKEIQPETEKCVDLGKKLQDMWNASSTN